MALTREIPSTESSGEPSTSDFVAIFPASTTDDQVKAFTIQTIIDLLEAVGTAVEVRFGDMPTSTTGSDWHTDQTDDDTHFQIRVGTGDWSASIPLGSGDGGGGATIETYADSTAYELGVLLIDSDNFIYRVNTAIASTNTTAPSSNSSCTYLGLQITAGDGISIAVSGQTSTISFDDSHIATLIQAGDGIERSVDSTNDQVTLSVDDDYIQGLAESSVVWLSHFSLGYVAHDALNTTDPTNHEWTNEEGVGNKATFKIRAANVNRGILASMEEGALIQVRAVGGASVVGTFTITEAPAAPDSTYLYQFVGEWDDTVSFNSGTNYPLYFSRPVETNFLSETEAADDLSNEFGLVSGTVLDSAVSEERIYTHVESILAAGDNLTITPDDTANTLTVTSSVSVQQRAETLSFQASATLDQSGAVVSKNTTTPLGVAYPVGATDNDIIALGTNADGFTILLAGIYDITVDCVVNPSGERVTSTFDIYEYADTVGTDDPIGQTDSVYLRYDDTNIGLHEHGEMIVAADNTAVKLVARNAFAGGASGATGNTFDLAANAVLRIARKGVRGEIGADGDSDIDIYEDFPTALDTALASADRIPIADTGTTGEPNRHVRIGVLQEYFTDLDSRITTEETTLADTDKFFFHDASASAMRYIEKSDFESALSVTGGGTTYTGSDGISVSGSVITIADDGVTLAKLASGTAGMYLGYDSSGDPAELTAPTSGSTYTAGTGIDVTGTVVSIANDGVTGTQVADDAIDSEHIQDDAVDLAHLASGTADMYLGYDSSGNPTELTAPTSGTTYTAGTGIAISSDTISIADVGVTRAKIALDAVDGTLIADDSIDSEHIVDDAVDLAHLASGTAGQYLGYDSSGNPAELDAPVNGDSSETAQRAEQLVFAAVTTVVTQTNDEQATLAATGFASVVYPSGETTLEILSATASETTATILSAGIYAIDISANIIATGDRAYPSLEVYASAAVIGTDNPLAVITTVYIREDATDVRRIVGSAHLRIASDDTVVKFNFIQSGYSDLDVPSYTVNSGAILTFNRLGVRGEAGASTGGGTTYTAGTGIAISSDEISIANDGVTGTQIADDAIDSEHIVDDSIDLAHLASGTADMYLGYDSSGNPAELTAPTSSGSGVDLYEDFPTEIDSTLVSQDRMVIADVDVAGEPNRHVRLDDLGDYFTDLRVRLPSAIASLAGVDRLFLSDESAAGDPMGYTTLTNLSNYILDLDSRITTEETTLADTDKFYFHDDSADAMRYIEKSDLESALSVGGGGTGTTYTAGTGISISGTAIGIANDGVTGAQIADDSIDSEHIASFSIDTEHISNDAIDGTLIADDSINSEHIVDNSVDLAHLASGTAGRYIGYNSSGNPAELAAPTNGGTGTTYTGGQGIAISGSVIELADDGVISEKIADDAILTAHVTDANITRAKIAADAIDGTRIADNAIAVEHIANDAVETDAIDNSAVTEGKIASNAVTTVKVNAGAITETKIGADAVTQAKIADDAVQLEHLNANTEISEANITDSTSNVIGTVTGRRIDLAINVLAPETQHYHVFVTRTLDSGGAGTTLSSSIHMIFYVFSGTEWDIEMFEHTDLPTNYLAHLQSGTDIRMVSGDTEWLGQITETLESSSSGAIFRINFSEQQTGSFTTGDSIRISFGYAPAAITLVSDGETLLGGGTQRDKFRINIDAPTSTNDAQVMAWSDGDSEFVWAANTGGTGGTTYSAGTGIAISAGNAISIADDGVDTAQIAAEAVETEQVNDDSITLGKLAHGTADTYVGFDSSGVPTELDAPVADLGEAAQRAEQLVFGAITTDVTQTAVQSATLAATGFAGVSYPDGETTLEMLSATASGTTATILNAGIYAVDFTAVVVAPGDRAYPSLDIYENSAVVGTDNPLAVMPTVYIREDSTFTRPVTGSAHLRIASDNTVIKFSFAQVGYTDITGTAPAYTVNAGAIITFNRLGTKGETGALGGSDFDLYEDFSTILSTDLNSADRMAIADTSLAGQPNRHVRVDMLSDYFGDLRNRISTALTTLADNDRVFASDEGTTDDPMRYVTLATLWDYILDLDSRISTEQTTLADTDKLFFYDDSANAMRYIEKSDLESELGGGGTTYTAGAGIAISGSAISIADVGVTRAKIALDAVDGTRIADDAIANEHLGSAVVESSNIGTGQIIESLLGSNAVTTVKIGTGAVTESKLGSDSVTGSKIANDAINSEHIANNSVDLAHLASGTAGMYLGYDTSGNPAELDAPTGGGVDLYEDFSTLLSTLNDVDRMAIADVGTTGQPNRYARLDDLGEYFANLRDHVPTSLSSALATGDRFFMSDENTAGDPMRYVSLNTLRNYFLDFDARFFTAQRRSYSADTDKFFFHDASANNMRYIEKSDLESELGGGGTTYTCRHWNFD